MSRPFLWMGLVLVAAPAIAFLVHRGARELGFLEPPIDRQHELRRTIMLAVYAFLLFLPVLVFGFGKRWPRAWVIFGILDGGALLFFAGSGAIAARELWALRHPEPVVRPPGGDSDDALASSLFAPAPPAGVPNPKPNPKADEPPTSAGS